MVLQVFHFDTCRAKVTDVYEIAALMSEVIEPLSYYSERARREELAKYGPTGLRQLIEDEESAIIVARKNGRIVGFCVSRYDDGTVWLSWFGTRTDVRGQGVGTSMLEALSRTLPRRRAHKIWCDTRVDNVRSSAVLERAGFRRITTLTNHWYGQDFHLWEWYP